MTRRSRFLTVLLSLVALLHWNAALAGYACPGSGKAVEIARMAEAAMPCAQTMSAAMDEEQAGLCHAHCQAGVQSAESYHPPAFADLLQLGVVLTVAVAARPVPASAPVATLLQRETGPPLAVRHCCFRL